MAILFGNTAYQAGNITGAASGLGDLFSLNFKWFVVPIGLLAWLLLMSGRISIIQNVLIVLVFFMSALFVLAAIVVRPNLGQIFQGSLIPTVPADAWISILALIGTTVVPYNLFLHSSAAATNWGDSQERTKSLRAARWDSHCSILVGGLITASILITASVAFGQGEQKKLVEIAKQLEPILGSASPWVFGVGMFAAGLTSAITAPLAAAYATSGCLGWNSKVGDIRFRAVFTAVILFGMITCLAFNSGKSPTQLIIVAQLANGLLLPIVAIFLLIVMNNSKLLGEYKNGWLANLSGFALLAVTLLIGGNSIFKAISATLGLFSTPA